MFQYKFKASFLFVLLVTFLHQGQGWTNLAFHKPCEEDPPSIWEVHKVQYAVDGDLNLCSHTQAFPLNWWMVDLQQVNTIHAVRIQNRVDCCQERLQNFTVEITTQNPKLLPGFPGLVGGVVCIHQTEAVISMTPVLFPCASPAHGRYIRVVKYGFDALTICEFEVFGGNAFELTVRGQHPTPAYTSLRNAGGILDCARLCWHNAKCWSFQYKDAGQVCELVDDKWNPSPGDQDLDWVLYTYTKQ